MISQLAGAKKHKESFGTRGGGDTSEPGATPMFIKSNDGKDLNRGNKTTLRLVSVETAVVMISKVYMLMTSKVYMLMTRTYII